MYIIIFASFICQWTLRFFCVLAIVDGTAVNIGVHLSSRIPASSGSMPRGGIAGSQGNSTYCFP